jgi:branched-chain amino acid transport system substrate-binding protein
MLQSSGAALVAANVAPRAAFAAPPTTPFRIGIIWSYTGGGPTSGPELDGAMAAFQKVHGDTVAGRKIEIVRRDDTGVNPEVARRLAQELVVQQKVDMIAGMIFTANAMTVGAISNESKTPVMLVNSVATGLLPKFPYMTRWSFTTLELTDVLGKWAAKNGYKNVYTIYHDNQSGVDSNVGFQRAFEGSGGKIVGVSPVPLNAGDFSAYVERAKDAKPDALFVFLLAGGVSAQFLKQLDAAGVQKAGIKILATGDLVSENNLPQMGDPAQGIVSAYHYSSTHGSALNKQYVTEATAIMKGNPYPSFAGCAIWDILTATYRALGAQGGNWDPDKAMAFFKGYKAESPRGPIMIDPDSRDIIQNIYLRRVEKRNGVLVNNEFATYPMVKSPEK